MQVKNFSVACSRNEQVQPIFQVSKTTSSNHQTPIVPLIINVNHKARKEIPLHEIERNEKNTHRTWKNQTNRKKNIRLKRRDASWFPRVPCSLLDARYRWNERAEIQRWGLDPAEKRWGIYLKWHRLDPRRPPKDLFPRRAALSGEKRGAVSLLFLPLFPSTCFFFSLRPTWREFLVRASREALVPRHFRWWPPTATAKHRAPRTNGSLIDPEMNQEMIFILVRRFLEFFVSPFLCFSSFF